MEFPYIRVSIISESPTPIVFRKIINIQVCLHLPLCSYRDVEQFGMNQIISIFPLENQFSSFGLCIDEERRPSTTRAYQSSPDQTRLDVEKQFWWKTNVDQTRLYCFLLLICSAYEYFAWDKGEQLRWGWDEELNTAQHHQNQNKYSNNFHLIEIPQMLMYCIHMQTNNQNFMVFNINLLFFFVEFIEIKEYT